MLVSLCSNCLSYQLLCNYLWLMYPYEYKVYSSFERVRGCVHLYVGRAFKLNAFYGLYWKRRLSGVREVEVWTMPGQYRQASYIWLWSTVVQIFVRIGQIEACVAFWRPLNPASLFGRQWKEFIYAFTGTHVSHSLTHRSQSTYKYINETKSF